MGIFNITPTPTVLQIACWLGYLVVVLALFCVPTGRSTLRTGPEPVTTQETERSTTRTALLIAATGIVAGLLTGLTPAGCTAKEDAGTSGAVATPPARRPRSR